MRRVLRVPDDLAMEQLKWAVGDRVLDARNWAAMPDAPRGTLDRAAAMERLAGAVREAGRDFPTVVTLCGSTKFKREFIEANFRETMAGKIVLTVGWFGHADGHVYTPTASEKEALDELHKRKIDLADEVLVINVGGYIGESTRSEIEYARARGVPVRYLVDPLRAAWDAADEEDEE